MAGATISLPEQLKGITLSRVAAGVIANAKNGWPSALSFDFAGLKFIRPTGVVFLSNLIWWLRENGVSVTFKNTKQQSPSLFYLDDSLFFEQHTGIKVRPQAAPRATTQPLVRIAHQDSHAWLDANLLPWLSTRLSITEASLYDIKSCLSEIFNSIQDHTRYDIGSIFVQHFPGDHSVEISVSDFGLGIPENVRKQLPDLNDAQAIVKATEEGFTTKSKSTNAGLGLDQLLKTVVLRNAGNVTIYSLRGIVSFETRNGSVASTVADKVGFCPGTTIEINLRTDTIETVPDEREELQW